MKRGLKLVKAAELQRPQPPAGLPDSFAIPSLELEAWATAVFIDSRGPFHVEEHGHLASAKLGFLWAAADNHRNGKRILATAEIPRPPQTGGAWGRARYWQQLAEWWPDELPDFIVTVWTGCTDLSDARFCQVVHHELRHCAQAPDPFGMPRFNRQTGLPEWAIQGHDWEGFASEVALFGVHDEALAEILTASRQPPRFSSDEIDGVCGTCAARVA